MGVDPLDAAGLQVLISQLTGVAEEMGAVLRRASFSPNIKERADCSAALFTADGQLLVQAEHIPVHLGSMPASVAAAIAAGIEVATGDQIILNDPFAGGTHLNDITLVAPCFVGGRIVGWAANRAHHADLGGMTAGSMPPEAVEIYQEGLRIPPVLLAPQVVAILLANSRTPEERRGDLDAQVGANAIGVERLATIVAGGAALSEVLAYGERRMRAALGALADGSWQVEDVIDSTGPRSSQQKPVTIRLTLTKTGERVCFDFTGTDRQRAGNVNAVEAVTYSAVAFALRSATDPTIPANGGALRPITLIAPGGSVVAARPPAAVGAGNVEVSQRVADVCLAALAKAAPGRVGAAGQGTMNNLILSGESGWVYYETIGGGQGGRPGENGAAGRAGMNGVHTAMTNTADTPTEALERSIQVRVLRYRLRHGSGGAGAAAGGEGIERVIQVLEAATASIITERRVSRPWGLNGGEPGAAGENWIWPGGDETARRPLLDKMTLDLDAGDAIQLLTPGGGGYGPPPVGVRESAQVRQAVRDGSLHSPTCGKAPGYVQANMITVPRKHAKELRLFFDRNPQACPLLEIITSGTESLMAPGSNLMTDIPLYRIFIDGQRPFDTTDAQPYWRDDFVSFLLGCSFTFDSILIGAGYRVRHVELGVNVPMFITNRPCSPTERFRGPLVVSMRPFKPSDIPGVTALTASRPLLHGPPLPVRDPSDIGITDINRPDFGDPVPIEASERPVFWACGVTPQLAIASANLGIAITHSPGHMFVTDVREDELDDWPRPTRIDPLVDIQ